MGSDNKPAELGIRSLHPLHHLVVLGIVVMVLLHALGAVEVIPPKEWINDSRIPHWHVSIPQEKAPLLLAVPLVLGSAMSIQRPISRSKLGVGVLSGLVAGTLIPSVLLFLSDLGVVRYLQCGRNCNGEGMTFVFGTAPSTGRGKGKGLVPGSGAIVAAVRGIEEGLSGKQDLVNNRFIPLVSTLGELFEEYQIIVVESNSRDRTRPHLLRWEWDLLAKKQEETLKLILYPRGQKHDPGFWRNIYLDEVHAASPSFDYMVALDGDLEFVDLEGVKDTLLSHTKTDWGAMVANGQRPLDKAYYDVVATRGAWNGHHWWYDSKTGNSRLVHVEMGKIIREFTVRIDESLPLLRVQSGFGGLGVYKTKYLKGCRYCMFACAEDYKTRSQSFIKNEKTCEHVPFNDCVGRNGGQIFVNPRMVTHWHYLCADCCADMGVRCEECTCAPLLRNLTWANVTTHFHPS